MSEIEATKNAVLQEFLQSHHSSDAVVIVRGACIENQTFRGNVILIADKISNVTVKGAFCGIFSSSFQRVHVRSRQCKTSVFVREDLGLLNMDISFGSKVNASINFLFQDRAQYFAVNGVCMSCEQFVEWWLHNRVNNCNKIFTPGISELLVHDTMCDEVDDTSKTSG